MVQRRIRYRCRLRVWLAARRGPRHRLRVFLYAVGYRSGGQRCRDHCRREARHRSGRDCCGRQDAGSPAERSRQLFPEPDVLPHFLSGQRGVLQHLQGHLRHQPRHGAVQRCVQADRLPACRNRLYAGKEPRLLRCRQDRSGRSGLSGHQGQPAGTDELPDRCSGHDSAERRAGGSGQG